MRTAKLTLADLYELATSSKVKSFDDFKNAVGCWYLGTDEETPKPEIKVTLEMEMEDL